MSWKSNLGISSLFAAGLITRIYNDEGDNFEIICPSVKQLLTDQKLSMFLSVFTRINLMKFKESLKLENDVDVVYAFLVDPAFTNLKEFKKVGKIVRYMFENFLVNFSIKERKLYVNNILINEENFQEILGVWRVACGFKEEGPKKFKTPAAKKLYEQQLLAEAKIASMKKKEKESEDSLTQVCLVIIYAFPSFSIEYLFELTLMQLFWLQAYALKVCSYNLESNAYANGNLKKAPKFFLGK